MMVYGPSYIQDANRHVITLAMIETPRGARQRRGDRQDAGPLRPVHRPERPRPVSFGYPIQLDSHRRRHDGGDRAHSAGRQSRRIKAGMHCMSGLRPEHGRERLRPRDPRDRPAHVQRRGRRPGGRVPRPVNARSAPPTCGWAPFVQKRRGALRGKNSARDVRDQRRLQQQRAHVGTHRRPASIVIRPFCPNQRAIQPQQLACLSHSNHLNSWVGFACTPSYGLARVAVPMVTLSRRCCRWRELLAVVETSVAYRRNLSKATGGNGALTTFRQPLVRMVRGPWESVLAAGGSAVVQSAPQVELAVWPADLHRWAKMAPDEKSAKGS